LETSAACQRGRIFGDVRAQGPRLTGHGYAARGSEGDDLRLPFHDNGNCSRFTPAGSFISCGPNGASAEYQRLRTVPDPI